MFLSYPSDPQFIADCYAVIATSCGMNKWSGGIASSVAVRVVLMQPVVFIQVSHCICCSLFTAVTSIVRIHYIMG